MNPELSWYHRSQSLKFLLHFLGDIHQPLHTESKLRGGNSIPVLFHNQSTNLHTVWDSRILDRHVGGNTDRHALALTEKLEARIDKGEYSGKKYNWTNCLDLRTVEKCAVAWAQDANDWVCKYVLKDDVEDQELGGKYADGAVEVIEELIAMAGYRLAGWMNVIITGRIGLVDDEEPVQSGWKGSMYGHRERKQDEEGLKELNDFQDYKDKDKNERGRYEGHGQQVVLGNHEL